MLAAQDEAQAAFGPHLPHRLILRLSTSTTLLTAESYLLQNDTSLTVLLSGVCHGASKLL